MFVSSLWDTRNDFFNAENNLTCSDWRSILAKYGMTNGDLSEVGEMKDLPLSDN